MLKIYPLWFYYFGQYCSGQSVLARQSSLMIYELGAPSVATRIWSRAGPKQVLVLQVFWAPCQFSFLVF